MDVTEVKTKFLIELDAVASGAAPGFTDDEISELVDKAQKDLIQQLTAAKKWDDLYTLTTKSLSAVGSGTYGNKTYTAALPNDFGYIISARVKAFRQDVADRVSVWFSCDVISPTIISRFLSTPFNTPFFKNPVIFFWDEDGSTEEVNIIEDTVTAIVTGSGSFELTYVKIPTKFSITDNNNLELPETLHDNIVEMAVKEAAKSLTVAKMTNQ